MKMKNQTHTKTQELLQNIEMKEIEYQDRRLPKIMIGKRKEIKKRDYNQEYLAVQK